MLISCHDYTLEGTACTSHSLHEALHTQVCAAVWGGRFFSSASGVMLLFLGAGGFRQSSGRLLQFRVWSGHDQEYFYWIYLFFILNPKRAAEGAFPFGCWLVITFMRKPGNWRLASPSPAMVARLLTCVWTLPWDPVFGPVLRPCLFSVFGAVVFRVPFPPQGECHWLQVGWNTHHSE